MNMQWEDYPEIPIEDLEDVARKMSFHIQKLVSERDNYYLVSSVPFQFFQCVLVGRAGIPQMKVLLF